MVSPRSIWSALLLAAAALAGGPAQGQAVSIDVVSSPPDLVTSPGVLVRVRGGELSPIGWASNDTLITPFYQNADGDWFGLIGLMDLLIPGLNLITVVPDQRRPMADVTFAITVHDPDAPLFGGPRPAGPACVEAAGGAGCAARTTAWVYRTTGGSWQRLPPAAAPPADTARTVTSGGRAAPMIVRVETGVINRAPYAIAFLDEPAASEPAPGQPAPMAAWNGTLVYGAGTAFAPGGADAARAGFFDLGGAGGDGCAAALVGLGYAVAAGMAAIGPAAEDATAAETLLRVRERFVKRYGFPRTTIGVAAGAPGETGTALARIAATYPGLDAVGLDPAVAAAAPECR